MGIENFIAFLGTALFFIMAPGIDTIFIINKSLSQGKISGTYAALGVNAGVIVHTLLAALGLSIILAQSATAFSVIKYAGAAYLVYLGIANLISKKEWATSSHQKQQRTTGKSNFLSGLVTNTLNPKVALFFLAFFPQFIMPNQLENPVPFILLGLTYAIIGTVWFLLLTYFAGIFSKKFEENQKAGFWLNKFSGMAFILLGIAIAFTKK